jgi:hypothetical protein
MPVTVMPDQPAGTLPAGTSKLIEMVSTERRVRVGGSAGGY